MPLFRPQTDRIGYVVLPTKANCAGCPDAWFHSGFGEQDVQGLYVEQADGTFLHLLADESDVRLVFPNERIFVVGRDGYYLTLAQARQAIDVDLVRSVAYVDDYNDEWQDVYVCDPSSFPHNIPGEEARRAEPIR